MSVTILNMSVPLFLYALLLCATRVACFKASAPIWRTPEVARSPQITELVEPSTGVRVYLVGSMHYNPYSIQQTTELVSELGETGQLGAVVLETDPVRWTAGPKNVPQILKDVFLNNEMRAGKNGGNAYGVPVSLGDQFINITLPRAWEELKQSFVDIVTFNWESLIKDLAKATSEAFPPEKDSGKARAMLDWRVLLGMPVSLIRYPAGIFIRSPVSFAIWLLVLSTPDLATQSLVQATDLVGGSFDLAETVAGDDDGTFSFALTLFALSLVQAVVVTFGWFPLLGRSFTRALLTERNVVLADNIVFECERLVGTERTSGRLKEPRKTYYDSGSDPNGFVELITSPPEQEQSLTALGEGEGGAVQSKSGGFLRRVRSLFSSGTNNEKSRVRERSDSSSEPEKKAAVSVAPGRSNKAVVAVLGMAHCRGVRALLEEGAVL
uniref:Uncharacterized protein n=1 Tax=Chromera velia CCMP2878 TaxID=1169474 RepID=A0A0G4FPF3_9ALVE|mmetsp:Transcript_17226/g.34938  ORF Transcript_17226/g.34938 Transcript_17226/m.34938 type:complete len:439 (-) Transcript_17226:271-1587(-)|eukprot:Cvel_18084.t1-p1 / transcript=Cvel_18084.t1 / gene=Cvel_18084 / organism=Chromera_velia_CCMP2878 / gene_product=hypothetical protein / transcript_product=hypothetical protein / location=Cvel_scaffold1480:42727-44040(-) / protein_length=438 / sequence_SO=supercontig / SO=protein_coding / is_pseudo=false